MDFMDEEERDFIAYMYVPRYVYLCRVMKIL